MKCAFFGIALLSASWLPAVGYFHLPDALAFAALLIPGVLLLVEPEIKGTRAFISPAPAAGITGRVPFILAAVLCAVAMVWIPWPYRTIPLLLGAGLAMNALPIPVRWPRALGSACIRAAIVLLAQSFALFAYTHLTARSHELPDGIAETIAAIARFVGIDAAYDGHNISLATMRLNHPMAATWELFINPATLLFLVGGLVFIGRSNWRGDLIFIACVLIWIPMRIAILLGLFIHRAIRLDYDSPILLMDQFWSTWIDLLLLLGPTLLAIILVPSFSRLACQPATHVRPSRLALAPLLAFTGAILLAFSLYYDPIGVREKGRVMFDEVHRVDMPGSDVHGWEPTDSTFDTESYGHNAAYTYSVLYSYLSHFYDVSRLTTKIDDQILSGCDVFVLKVPTKQLEPTEISALVKFVKDGGGLMLIGEHTDVFGTGTYLNDVARRFGFRYRYDCLFDIDQVFQERYRAAAVPHPIVQNLPELDWAVSCSIEPRLDWGGLFDRDVMVATGLRNLPADYHASNFYPQVEDRADARYGAFVQMLAQRQMDGRVIAFSDSTQFSNFCLFDPGKSELFLGMTEWLNHHTSHDDPRLPLAGLAAIALLAAWTLSRSQTPMALLAISAGLAGWSIAIPAICSLQMRAMPLPKQDASLKRVVMDRTICDSTLPLAGFIAGKPDGYGIFERWILRLGYFTSRKTGSEALRDQLLIFANPDKPVPADFLSGVEKYVSDGGKILVIDSAENQSSTANSLLAPFHVHFNRETPLNGDLDLSSPSATTQPTTTPIPIPVTNALETVQDDAKPEALAKIADKPVSMTIRHGKGTVTLVGYGTRFSDLNMGFTGDNPPDAAMRAVYQVEFDLMRKIVEGE